MQGITRCLLFYRQLFSISNILYCVYFLTQNIRKTYQYIEKQRIEQLKQLQTDEVGDAVAKAKKLSVETNKRRKYVLYNEVYIRCIKINVLVWTKWYRAIYRI